MVLSVPYHAMHAYVQGLRLYGQQAWALFAKRAISARRDRLAVVMQLAVPIALVLVALWARRASDAFPPGAAAGHLPVCALCGLCTWRSSVCILECLPEHLRMGRKLACEQMCEGGDNVLEACCAKRSVCQTVHILAHFRVQ